MRKTYLNLFAFLYKHLFRPIFFLWDSETVHTFLVHQGERAGNDSIIRFLISAFFVQRNSSLSQTLHGIPFTNPVGLSAGFDYDARLTQILPTLGFGFGTIGTVTYMPYEGNRKPMLGRLIKSQSLMVNKGLKNRGVEAIIKKLSKKKFVIPIGISIGMTNTKYLQTYKQAIHDIVASFRAIEKSSIPFAYYELNISCPNMHTHVTFDEDQPLSELLQSLKNIQLSKPLFVKMPISVSNARFLEMLSVLIKFPIAGIIVGNLQKDRSYEGFDKKELQKYPMGNFSGKPTQERSNELISLAYKKYGKKLTIIGCGGIFSAKDAYEKIQRGASVVQLITGMVFEGPQLIAQINTELPELLHQDGFMHIAEAVGSGVS